MEYKSRQEILESLDKKETKPNEDEGYDYHKPFFSKEVKGTEWGWFELLIHNEIEDLKVGDKFDFYYQDKLFSEMTFNTYGKKGMESVKAKGKEDAMKYITEENKTVLYFLFDLEDITYSKELPHTISKYNRNRIIEPMRLTDIKIIRLSDGYMVPQDNIYKLSF